MLSDVTADVYDVTARCHSMCSMQRLSTAVTDVLHVQLLAGLYASSVLRDCGDQRGDSALVDHGAVPVLRRCLRDAQHAGTCCDSML